jgi:hypothetical protein
MFTSRGWVALVAVAAVAFCACGKGSDDKVTQKSKLDDVLKAPLSPPPPADDSRTRRCGPGQADDAGKCVTVVDEAALAALDAQLGKLDSADAVLAKVELLVAPITLLAALRELSAWKAAVAGSRELATIDAVVTTLEANVTELKTAAATVKNSRQLLAEVLTRLSEIHLGKGPDVALTDLRALASDKLGAAVIPLQGELATLSSGLGGTTRAALVQIDKARALACAVIALGGDAELAELCKSGEAGITQARDFITEVESVSGELIVELLGVVDEHLIELLSEEVRKRLAAARVGP